MTRSWQDLLESLGRKSRIERITPRSSVRLTQAQFNETLKICEWINASIDSRVAYIDRHGLDRDIHHPAANWALDSAIFNGFRAMAARKFESVNAMRVFTQMFSGYYLGVHPAAGTQVPRELPEGLDDFVDSCLDAAEKDAWWLQRYRTLIREEPSLAGLSPPKAFAESGFLIQGAIVSHDTYVYLERVWLLLATGLVERLRRKEQPVVLEVGCGYGALAYFVKALVPNCTYICVDLPESLIFSTIYLSRFHGESVLASPELSAKDVAPGRYTFVPNYLFHRLVESGLKIDLALNTLSMSEMSEDQVSMYCGGLTSMLGDDGVFFEQNQDNRPIGLLFARELVAPHFRYSMSVESKLGITQGVASLWSSSATPLQSLSPGRSVSLVS